MSLLIATLAASLGCTSAETAAGTHYRIDISADGGASRVFVAIDFTGDADGMTEITLPDSWGGQNELWNAIADLRIAGEGASLEAGASPAERIARHAPCAPLTLNYEIVQDRPGEPQAAAGDYYRPYLRADYVHLIGNTAMVRPAGIEDGPVGMSISVPEGWALASDLEHDALDAGALSASVLVAGDFRTLEHPAGEDRTRLAVRGDIGTPDAVLADAVAQVVEADSQYWNEAPGDYLVTVLPLESEPGHMSIGGTNLGDAFAFFATRDADPGILLRILMHEHVHSWNPRRLGGLPEGEAEPGAYWFSEGFTDFLTQRVAVRAGLWDAATALESWNEALRENAESPAGEAGNADIVTGFWTSPDLQRLPYHRGMIFAALLDTRIRDASGGARDLDDVLREMRAMETDRTAPERLAAVMSGMAGIDYDALFRTHIADGHRVSLPPDSFRGCGTVETIEEPVFDYGMSGSRDADGLFVIESVDPQGPAWPAGFRPGMAVLERLAGSVGDASTDSTLRVREEDGTVRELSYRPTNGEILSVQRIVMDEAGFDERHCARSLAGLTAGAD